MNMILGFFQIVSAAKGRCEKLGHAVFMVWLVVVLGIYPTVYCSSSFSFLGHPDKFHICFLEEEESHWLNISSLDSGSSVFEKITLPYKL